MGEAVEDGVDDFAVAEDEDYAAGKAYDEGCGHDVFAACEEEFGEVVGFLTVGNAGKEPHGKEEGGNFHDIPAVAEHACHEIEDGEKQEVEDEEMYGLAQGYEACDDEKGGEYGHDVERGTPPPYGYGGGWIEDGDND